MVDSTQGGENPPKGVPPGVHSYGAVYALRLAGTIARRQQLISACRVFDALLVGGNAKLFGVCFSSVDGTAVFPKSVVV